MSLSLDVRRGTKALLVALKEEYDLPFGRLLDRAVEELALKLMGERKVAKITKATRGAKNVSSTPIADRSASLGNDDGDVSGTPASSFMREEERTSPPSVSKRKRS